LVLVTRNFAGVIRRIAPGFKSNPTTIIVFLTPYTRVGGSIAYRGINSVTIIGIPTLVSRNASIRVRHSCRFTIPVFVVVRAIKFPTILIILARLASRRSSSRRVRQANRSCHAKTMIGIGVTIIELPASSNTGSRTGLAEPVPKKVRAIIVVSTKSRTYTSS